MAWFCFEAGVRSISPVARKIIPVLTLEVMVCTACRILTDQLEVALSVSEQIDAERLAYRFMQARPYPAHQPGLCISGKIVEYLHDCGTVFVQMVHALSCVQAFERNLDSLGGSWSVLLRPLLCKIRVYAVYIFAVCVECVF